MRAPENLGEAVALLQSEIEQAAQTRWSSALLICRIDIALGQSIDRIGNQLIPAHQIGPGFTRSFVSNHACIAGVL
jgi:hypothetical protein